ncbi:hypothetical protein TruAng_000140 [Truncatella angustata]|nr:hypothetical protein TruAng_000140 [Truncatella angustata]
MAGSPCLEAQNNVIRSGGRNTSEDVFYGSAEYARYVERLECGHVDEGDDQRRVINLSTYCLPECADKHKSYLPQVNKESPLKEVHFPAASSDITSAVVAVNHRHKDQARTHAAGLTEVRKVDYCALQRWYNLYSGGEAEEIRRSKHGESFIEIVIPRRALLFRYALTCGIRRCWESCHSGDWKKPKDWADFSDSGGDGEE